MSQLNITCPHCGFSKNIDQQRIPPGVKTIKCPKCQQSFAFEPNQETASSIELAEIQPRQELPPASSQAQTTNGGGDGEYSKPFRFCSSCGQKIQLDAENCPKCGARRAPSSNAVSKVGLLLITFFFGGLGGHRFYQKKYLLGMLYLLFFWAYIPSLVAFIEFIIYATKSEAELQQKYPESSNGAIVAVALVFFGIAIIGILAAIAIPQFASYREKAFNAVARNDLNACKDQVEAYYAAYRVHPTKAGQMQCQASKDVALFYLVSGPDAYQLISFHDHGKKAFLLESSGVEIAENTKDEIEQQLEKKFGSSALARSFHFME